MSWGSFEHLNNYLAYGLRKFSFKNTIGNRPLLSPVFFIMNGGGGGWTESFFLFLFLDTYIKYSTCIGKYTYQYNFVQTKNIMGFKIWSSWGVATLFPNSPNVRQFLFFGQKLHFLRDWVLFLVLFFLSKEGYTFKINGNFIVELNYISFVKI